MGAPEQCRNCTGVMFDVVGLEDSRLVYQCSSCGTKTKEEFGGPTLKPCEGPDCSNWISEEESYCRRCSAAARGSAV